MVFLNKKLEKKNQKGVLTIDFVFSFTLILGFFSMFYMLTYTLMVSSVAQYITFASARVFFAGNIDVQSQTSLAEKKFDYLVNDTYFSAFFNGPFELTNFEVREFDEYSVRDSFRQKFIGSQVQFESKILDFNVPFLGSTSSELEGDGFKAQLGSYLYREPTSKECMDFNEERARAILDLSSKFRTAEGFGFNPDDTLVMADNGC